MPGGKGRQADDRDDRIQQDDEPDGAEEAARQVASGPARLLGEVRNRLESGVREHRERKYERD